MSQQRTTNNRKQLWREYANSQEEYDNKIRLKELNEIKLSSHEDLLSFFLLKKSSDKILATNDEQFNIMPDKYIRDIRDGINCSLPLNFGDNIRKTTQTNLDLTNDISLLASLLGGYNPPRNCNIQLLDRQSIEILSLPNNLKPILPKNQSQQLKKNNINTTQHTQYTPNAHSHIQPPPPPPIKYTKHKPIS
eukprot:466689_1